ncbi:putative ABC transporter [Enterococcus faecalis 13-SD-W-01]|nr:putative ABC transporter [Enterococcus faecalis 13-SD-W-01]
MKSLKQLLVLTKRIMKQNITNADTLITVVGTPVFMLLFFVYVFGGSIAVSGSETSAQDYLNYSLPGFLLITMTMGSAYTALRINNDKLKGFLNRLHSLPIKRWVILGSHVTASVLFMILAEAIIFLIGLVMGFEVKTSLFGVLGFFGLSVLFAFAITLLAIPFSLKAKSYEGAGGFSYILIMLLFVSSALMPMDGMAKPIELFAKYQPMTPIVETARNLLNATFSVNASYTIQASAWLIGLIVLFALMSYKRYQKVFSNV